MEESTSKPKKKSKKKKSKIKFDPTTVTTLLISSLTTLIVAFGVLIAGYYHDFRQRQNKLKYEIIEAIEQYSSAMQTGVLAVNSHHIHLQDHYLAFEDYKKNFKDPMAREINSYVVQHYKDLVKIYMDQQNQASYLIDASYSKLISLDAEFFDLYNLSEYKEFKEIIDPFIKNVGDSKRNYLSNYRSMSESDIKKFDLTGGVSNRNQEIINTAHSTVTQLKLKFKDW